MIFWLVETIFFHFLKQQPTAASGGSFLFNWNIFFSKSFIPASENEFLSTENSIFLFQVFYC